MWMHSIPILTKQSRRTTEPAPPPPPLDQTFPAIGTRIAQLCCHSERAVFVSLQCSSDARGITPSDDFEQKGYSDVINGAYFYYKWLYGILWLFSGTGFSFKDHNI